MENNNQYSEFARKVIKGVKQAQQKLIREKAIRGEDIIVGDDSGNITFIAARNVLKNI